MAKYLIRLDDACETMCLAKWQRMGKLLGKYDVKPLVGVIPANADPEQVIDPPNDRFWATVAQWQLAGWEICIHGYNHVYLNKNGGLHPVNNYSEFAGLDLDQQKEKINQAVDVFNRHGIDARVFFAPGHSFDKNTLRALFEASDIRIVSDTVALQPYKWKDMVFMPQQMGHCRAVPFGTITFCYHPNSMNDNDFDVLEKFLRRHSNKFTTIPIEIVKNTHRSKSVIDKLLTSTYFALRKCRRLVT